MSRASMTPSTSNSFNCEPKAGTFEDEGAIQRDYYKEVANVQHAMGLQSDDWMFAQVKMAVAAVARKLDLMSCPVPLNVGEAAKSEKSQFSLKLKRAAWWVRDRLPLGSNYQSLSEPIYALLEIRRSEIAKREACFRARSASTATLPDFDLLLELEELDAQNGHP
ncbi:hypothetical protein BKA70DRAFT_1431348 [Coprinopsis sp. MPI-PUGE-AT-0042]|nr:hypothetical protein BKA70DRAFT_1431348 [Coprinopsis sp. MPI-PUGE-AT-0042]